MSLTPKEIIAHCREQGISVTEFLKIPKLPKDEAITAYINEEITEGRLMYHLGCDRLEARRIVQDFIQEAELMDSGAVTRSDEGCSDGNN